MKKLYVSVERRYKFFAGKYYVQGIEDGGFFSRYLDVFDKVNVIARVEKVYSPPIGHKIFAYDAIDIIPIFTTGTGTVNIIRIVNIIREIKGSSSHVILRTPGVLSYLLSIYLMLSKNKFSLEVVTNPLQEARNLTQSNVLKNIFSLIFLFIFRKQLRLCQFASFVTKQEIQREFISLDDLHAYKYNSSYSSVVLNGDDFASPKLINDRILRVCSSKKIHLLFIGVLDRPFKGLDVFINLLSKLPDNYYGTVIGDGHLLNSYKKMATDLALDKRINFKGYIDNKKEKQHAMSEADIFVLTSRREGLPRVVIEAMAWGLPCICSHVSGVSELVDESCIFPIDDFDAACRIIINLAESDLGDMSKNNLENALQYKNSILNKSRIDFYQKVIRSENFTFK